MGVFCGVCVDGYSEILFFILCRCNEDCNDVWFWLVVIIYFLVVVIFFVIKFFIVFFLVEYIFWFRKFISGEDSLSEKSLDKM